MTLTEEVLSYLYGKGAALAGVADVSALCEWPRAICVALPLPKVVVRGIHNGPTPAYLAAYKDLNQKLDQIVEEGAAFLRGKGYRAKAQSTTFVAMDLKGRARLPHKTVATAAGLGWVGRSALLITPEFGGAQRLSSLVTDAPLDPATPVTASRCGSCRKCVDACPGKALQGPLWTPQTDRETLVDVSRCIATARPLCEKATGEKHTICGKCFEVCPYTQRYLNEEV